MYSILKGLNGFLHCQNYIHDGAKL